MFSPEVLVLDEPTGGLDEVGRRMLTKIIRMMHDNGHTVDVYKRQDQNTVYVFYKPAFFNSGKVPPHGHLGYCLLYTSRCV